MKYLLLGILALATLGAFIIESTEFLGYKKYTFKDNKLHIHPQGRILESEALITRAENLKRQAMLSEWQKKIEAELFKQVSLDAKQMNWLKEKALWSEIDSAIDSQKIKSWVEKTRQHLFQKYGVK